MSKKLQEIIDFFEQAEGWSKDEIIADYIAEIKDLRGCEPDEIGLQWDDNVLMVLSDFAEIFFNKTIDGVCNVLESFKENEEE